MSYQIPHCRRWCSWGTRWVWWDVWVAVEPRGTCSPWCEDWTCLCVGSIVPSYLSEHTEASWRWRSPGWSGWGFYRCTGTSWWSLVTPWLAGTTSSQTMTFDLRRQTAKTETRCILISDSALFDDWALFVGLYAITLPSWRQKAHLYAQSINGKELIYSHVQRTPGINIGSYIGIKTLVSNSHGKVKSLSSRVLFKDSIPVWMSRLNQELWDGRLWLLVQQR